MFFPVLPAAPPHIAIAPVRTFGETSPVIRHLCCLLALGASLRSAVAAAPAAPPRPGENYTVPDLSLALIWVAPGTFTMRSTLPAGDDTEVTLTRGYWLGRTEVTQAQWELIAAGIPIYQNIPRPSRFKGSDHPVETITWFMAVAFCARLTERERAAGRLPAGYVYALPTEAQWEYACRAGSTATRVTDLDAVAWYEADSQGETHPVARKRPNAWGFHDMLGNVNEWCADWYGGYPGGSVRDPAGPPLGVYRLLRGGAFASTAGGCRPAQRACARDWELHSGTGMRVALVPAPAGDQAGTADSAAPR